MCLIYSLYILYIFFIYPIYSYIYIYICIHPLYIYSLYIPNLFFIDSIYIYIPYVFPIGTPVGRLEVLHAVRFGVLEVGSKVCNLVEASACRRICV